MNIGDVVYINYGNGYITQAEILSDSYYSEWHRQTCRQYRPIRIFRFLRGWKALCGSCEKACDHRYSVLEKRIITDQEEILLVLKKEYPKFLREKQEHVRQAEKHLEKLKETVIASTLTLEILQNSLEDAFQYQYQDAFLKSVNSYEKLDDKLTPS